MLLKTPIQFPFAYCVAHSGIDGFLVRRQCEVQLHLSTKKEGRTLRSINIITVVWNHPFGLDHQSVLDQVHLKQLLSIRISSRHTVCSCPLNPWLNIFPEVGSIHPATPPVGCDVSRGNYSAWIILSCLRRPCTLYQTFRWVCIFEPFDDVGSVRNMSKIRVSGPIFIS